MESGRREDRDRAVVRADQQLDLGAPQDDPLRPSCDEAVDHVAVGRTRLVADDAEAELVVDDPVHQCTVVGLGHLGGDALRRQALDVEPTLHGERRREQPDVGQAGARDRRGRHVDQVQQRDRHGLLHLVGDEMHRVGAQHHHLRAPRLQHPRTGRERLAGVLPAGLALHLGDRREVDGVHQAVGRVETTESLAHQLVEQPVVLDAALPAHPAEQSDPAHHAPFPSARSVSGRRTTPALEPQHVGHARAGDGQRPAQASEDRGIRQRRERLQVLDVHEERANRPDPLDVLRHLVGRTGQGAVAPGAVEILGEEHVLGNLDRVLQQPVDEDHVDPDQLAPVPDGLAGHLADVGDELQLQVVRLGAPVAGAEVGGDVLPLDVERPVHGRRGLEGQGEGRVTVRRIGRPSEEGCVALDLDQVEAGGRVDHLLEQPRGVDLGVGEAHPVGAHVLGVTADVGDEEERPHRRHVANLQGPWVVGVDFGRIGALIGCATSTGLVLVVRREAVEHRVDRGPRLARARRVAEHHREEVVGSQRLQPELAAGEHGGRPADPAEQCDLAEPLPRPERRHAVSVTDHLGLARLDHEVAVADLALVDHGVASGHLDGFQAAGELLDRRQRQRVQHAHPLQQPDVAIADVDRPVHAVAVAATRPPRRRTQETDDHQGGTYAGQLDQQRRDDRPDPDGEGAQALQHSEDPSKHRIRRQPAQEREAAEVDQGVADADAGEQAHCCAVLREDTDQRDRHTPQGHADGVARTQSPGVDQQGRAE